eukprot:TRINITY_DN4560_c0_g1_i1.p1 TRINITY_DN4560_c0_g1~~TRINITY_DN4560_c0_g1_i1.p1  ORF type:complete len:223 (-),score=28.88 TRINITY_DN4560_c0_g1_i1:805-1473(-)
MTAAINRQLSLERFMNHSKGMPISRSSSGSLNVMEPSICRSESPLVPSHIGIWAVEEGMVEERTHFDGASPSTIDSFKFPVGSGIQSSPPSCGNRHAGSVSPVESALSKALANRKHVPVILNVLPSPDNPSSSSVQDEQANPTPARVTSNLEVTAEVTPAEQLQPCISSNVESLHTSSTVVQFLVGIVSRISCHPLLSSAAQKVTAPSQRVYAMKSAALIRL